MPRIYLLHARIRIHAQMHRLSCRRPSSNAYSDFSRGRASTIFCQFQLSRGSLSLASWSFDLSPDDRNYIRFAQAWSLFQKHLFWCFLKIFSAAWIATAMFVAKTSSSKGLVGTHFFLILLLLCLHLLIQMIKTVAKP